MHHFILYLGIILIFDVFVANADPQPIGGMNCTRDEQCDSITGGGNCTDNQCICSYQRGNPDCSYIRKDRILAGGLQFLCFIGIGGIGNFILERAGYAIGQLILMIAYVFMIALLYCSCCGLYRGTVGKIFGMAGGITCGVILICAVMAGLIWSIIDAAMILGGNIVDGNGYTTYDSINI